MSRKRIRLCTLVIAVCMVFSMMGVAASAEDTVIEKIYATSDKEAVAMRTPGEIVFTTSTKGASVSSVTWTGADGVTLAANEAFKQGTYTLVVTLKANDGYVFGVAASGYLYGKTCDIAVSADGKTASLRRNIQAVIWSPIIVKQPAADPPVNPGGRVSYAATANFASTHTWYLISPDGKEKLDLISARDKFPGVIFTDTLNSLTIDNVKAEMNGWKAMCRFYEDTGVYFTDTAEVEIAVNLPAATPTPEPEPTPEASAEPTPEPTPEPVAQTRAWQFNEGGHWHENAAGETSELAEHSYVWSAPNEKGEEQGVCSVCGYTTTRMSESVARQELKGKLLIGLGVAVAILMMLSLAAPKKKKHKR